MSVELTPFLYSDVRRQTSWAELRTVDNFEKVRRGGVFASRAPGFGGSSSGSGGGNYGSSVVYNIGRVVARAAADSSSKKPTVDYLSFVARDQPHCYEIKTVWGLGIALCVLFAFSSIVCAGLWRRVKGPGSSAADKDLEG